MCSGAPRIDGTRLTVFNLVMGIEGGALHNYCNEFEISEASAFEALDYCMKQQCKNGALIYCYGCVLHAQQDSSSTEGEVLEEFKDADGLAIIKIDG